MTARLQALYRDLKPTTLLALPCYRLGHWIWATVRVPVVRQLLLALYAVLDTVVVKLVCHAELPPRCRIGRRPAFKHGVSGIVINGGAVIGDFVTIYHQVTVGTAVEGGPAPVIGDRVLIGAGAKVLGGITVGDDAVIGANAVVVHDVPAGATVGGVPARLLHVGRGVPA